MSSAARPWRWRRCARRWAANGDLPGRPRLGRLASTTRLRAGWAAGYLQHDRLNRSDIQTVVAAAVTSQLKYARFSGNVRLAKGEAGLPRASVVNVTQIATVDRTWIQGRLGTLSAARLAEIWDGLLKVLEPRLTALE